MTSSFARAGSGDKVTIYGQGFIRSDGRDAPLSIRIGDRQLADQVKVDAEGNFKHEILVDLASGEYLIIVEQQDGKRLTQGSDYLVVVPSDEFEKRDKR